MFLKQMKLICTISLVSVIASAVAAGEVAQSTEIRAIAMSDATIEQLARNPVVVSRAPRPHERRRQFVAASAPESSITATVALPSTSTPPPATLTFRATGSSFYYPADASGAVGQQQVVGAFNSGLTVQDRAGNYLRRVSLDQFWLDPAFAIGVSFDPRVVYDNQHDRWVLIALNDVNQQKSTLLLAVSQNGDAAGVWRRFRIPLDPFHVFGDFTRLALTGDQIAVTLNHLDIDANLFTVPKADAYDPSAQSLPVTRTHFPTLDVTPVANADGGDPRLRVITMGAGSSIIVSDIVDGRETRTVSYQSPISYNIDSPYLVGRQLGSTMPMDAGPAMVHYAVSRGGTTWVVQTVGMPPGGNSRRAAVLIWRIAGASARVNLIDSASDAISVSYPSIAVNRLGGALIAYSLFDASRYASAAYVYIDPFDNMSTAAILRTGEGPYDLDRWGDYTATVVDPVDGIGFWTVQVYPSVPLPTQSLWSTYWSKFTLPPVRRRAAHH